MCFSSESKTENAVYIISSVMLFFAVMLLPFAKPQYSALICCFVILTIIITLTVSNGGARSTAGASSRVYPYSYSADVTGVDDDAGEKPVSPLAIGGPPPRARLCPLSRPRHFGSSPGAAAVADVPGNVWGQAITCSSDACADDDPAILLPVIMEGSAASRSDDAPQCGGVVEVLSNLPPFPGVVAAAAAALNGRNGVWRVPEWPADQPSREGTIAAVVSDLPECAEQTPRDIIRNKGLYGIKGNTSCDLLKRSAVADTGFIQPIGARNAFLAYDSYDQLHAKDQFLVPIITPQKF
jgi:hypothetical protein